MTLGRLNSQQQDRLCRLSQQGMMQAAAMLSRLLHQPVEVKVCDAWMSDCRATTELPLEPHLGVFMQLVGDVEGGLLLALSEPCAEWLSRLLLGTPSSDLLVEPASSTLKEVGNIIASSFLASIDDQLGLRAMPSPPKLCHAPLDSLLQSCQPSREACLIIRTNLQGGDGSGAHLQGAAIYLLPEPAAMEKLISKIDQA